MKIQAQIVRLTSITTVLGNVRAIASDERSFDCLESRRAGCLVCADVLVSNYAAHVEPRLLAPIVDDAVLLLSEADLHLTQLVLTLLCDLLRAWPPSATGASTLAGHLIKQLWPQLHTLVLSAWLQGAAMHALQQLVAQLALNRFALVPFQELLQARVSRTHT